MLYKKKKAQAHVFLMLVLIVQLALNQTPGSRATVTEEMASDPKLMVSNETYY